MVKKESTALALTAPDPDKYGLTTERAAHIGKMFRPMLDTMEGLEKEFNEVIQLPMSEETSAAAKELRLRYVKARTGTAAIHKELKADFLNGGRLVDAWKNTQKGVSDGVEGKLKEIEEHAENLERERIRKVQDERHNILEGLLVQNIPLFLGTMEDETWKMLHDGAVAGFETFQEDERRAEEERKMAEQKAEQERIAVENKAIAQAEENERLKKEAEEKELAHQKELKEQQAKAEKEREKEREKEKKAEQKRYDKAEKEREQAEWRAAQEADKRKVEAAKAKKVLLAKDEMQKKKLKDAARTKTSNRKVVAHAAQRLDVILNMPIEVTSSEVRMVLSAIKEDLEALIK